MTDIKTLLDRLLNRILTTPQINFFGMCDSITVLQGYCDFEIIENAISNEDAMSLRQYLRDNKPRDIRTCFWWDTGDKHPRIDWLKGQIEIGTTVTDHNRGRTNDMGQ